MPILIISLGLEGVSSQPTCSGTELVNQIQSGQSRFCTQFSKERCLLALPHRYGSKPGNEPGDVFVIIVLFACETANIFVVPKQGNRYFS
jgi:hypothetical protein